MRVAVVASSRAYCEALVRVLDVHLEPRIEAKPYAPSEARAVQLWSPQVLVVDALVPCGPVMIRDFVAGDPTIRTVAVKVTEDGREVIARALAGASSCLAREASVDEVIDAIRRAADWETTCSPCFAVPLYLHAAHASAGAAPAGIGVTRREREILHLLARGLTNKEIARLLHVEVSTVKNHTHRLFAKLGVHTREDAVARIVSSPVEGAPPPNRSLTSMTPSTSTN